MAGRVLYDIVTDGLKIYLDAGRSKSYTDGSDYWYNMVKHDLRGLFEASPTYNSAEENLLFDGTDDACDLSSKVDYVDINKGTFVIVVKAISIPANRAFFSFRVNSENNIAILVDNSARYQFKYKGSNTTKQVEEVLSIGSGSPFRVLSMTYDTEADELKAYVNGVQVGSTITSLGTFTGTPDFLKIARAETAWTNCGVKSFQYYDKVLTAEEISQNYNTLKSRFGL